MLANHRVRVCEEVVASTPGWSAKRKLSRNASAVTEARFHRGGEQEQGALARFRYSCLKEAARGCGGRGPYGNSMEGKNGVELYRDCAREHGRRHRAPGSWLPRKSIAKRVAEGTGRRDSSCGKAQGDGAWRNTRRIRAVESRFMRLQ